MVKFRSENLLENGNKALPIIQHVKVRAGFHRFKHCSTMYSERSSFSIIAVSTMLVT